MADLTIDQALQLAIANQQARKFADAEALCRQILLTEPNHAGTFHLLGVLCAQRGDRDRSIDYFRKAVASAPENAEYHYNLGNLIGTSTAGRLAETIACYRRALEIDPALAAARYNLGNALKEKGDLDGAIAEYRHAILIRPDYAMAYNNLGNAWKKKGQFDHAVQSYHHALEIQPRYPQALQNLANTLRDANQIDAAIQYYRRALELKGYHHKTLHDLGIAYWKSGQLDAAISSYRQAIEIWNNYAEAHYSLGIALRDKTEPDEAIAAYQRAIEINPSFCDAYNNLAGVFWENGRLDQAIICYRRAIEIDPDFISAHDNLLYALPFHPASTSQTIFADSQRWNLQHAKPLERFITPHTNDRNPDRRLRIGYVSPDFRRHPVGRSLLPAMMHHDVGQVEVICYSSTTKPDSLTPRFRQHAALWRDMSPLSDQELATQIREDRIDILVDLTLHMAGSRLLVFARKPAPVQVTWLGYPGTTGLQTIDYRLTDPFMDPPGLNDEYYSEKSIRLPDTFQCYDPLTDEIPISAPPATNAGNITFGCLNNFAKINQPLLETWSQILRQIPSARLILKTGSPTASRWAMEIFQRNNISPERIDFPGDQPSHEAYLNLYHRIDIALDPFPYNGHTTSMDALWMGVPVISRYGTTAVSRAGLSQSSNLALPELATDSQKSYVTTAISLAQDLRRLIDHRATLRDKMQASPLMDAPQFTRNLESAYRAMWRRWCAS